MTPGGNLLLDQSAEAVVRCTPVSLGGRVRPDARLLRSLRLDLLATGPFPLGHFSRLSLQGDQLLHERRHVIAICDLVARTAIARHALDAVALAAGPSHAPRQRLLGRERWLA